MASTAPSLPVDTFIDRSAINRENALHSTGPRSDDGKSRIRLNACKHGIYSKAVVLPGEDQSHFLALGKAYLDHYQPQTAEEIELVERLHATQWRLSRVVALDINLHTLGTEKHLEEIDNRFGELDDPARYALAQAAAFVANSRMFDQLSRHEARLQRLYDRTVQVLDLILAQRQPIAIHRPPAAPAIANPGFVPSIAADTMPKFTGPMADIKRKQWLRQQETLRRQETLQAAR